MMPFLLWVPIGKSNGNGPSAGSPVSDLDPVSLSADFPVRVAGEVPPLIRALIPFYSPGKWRTGPRPSFPMPCWLCIGPCLKAVLSLRPTIAPRVAITFSTAVGGLDAVLQADRLMIAGRKDAASLYQSEFLY